MPRFWEKIACINGKMDGEMRIKITLPQDPINSTFILNFFNLPVHFTEKYLWKALSTLDITRHVWPHLSRNSKLEFPFSGDYLHAKNLRPGFG